MREIKLIFFGRDCSILKTGYIEQEKMYLYFGDNNIAVFIQLKSKIFISILWTY